jgi:hypothetical protein
LLYFIRVKVGFLSKKRKEGRKEGRKKEEATTNQGKGKGGEEHWPTIFGTHCKLEGKM